MHVQRKSEPEPDFQSTASLIAERPMSLGRMLALTAAVAAVTMALLVASADLGWLPDAVDDGAAALAP